MSVKQNRVIRGLIVLVLWILTDPAIGQSQLFTDVAFHSGLRMEGITSFGSDGGLIVLDFNNDGWEDYYIPGGPHRDLLYKNNGDGTFSEIGNQAGLSFTSTIYTNGGVAGDIDNDGDRDIFLTTIFSLSNTNQYVRNILLENQGNGTFLNITSSAGLVDRSFSAASAFGDYNNDGYIDLYVCNMFSNPLNSISHGNMGNLIGLIDKSHHLYLNNGNNTFTDITDELRINGGGLGLACMLSDYDNDADVDILVGNDFQGGIHKRNLLYRNEFPDNYFTDQSEYSGTDEGKSAMGIASGDFNEDGLLDYYIANEGRNTLYMNDGDGRFTDRADEANLGDVLVPVDSDESSTCITYTAPEGYFGEDKGAILVCGLQEECNKYSINVDVSDRRPTYHVSDNSFHLEVAQGSSLLECLKHSSNDHIELDTNSGSSMGMFQLEVFEDHAPAIGWGVIALDFDNDMHLDLFIANGAVGSDSPNTNSLYKGDGTGSFISVSSIAGVMDPRVARGSVSSDYDNDGDLDILVYIKNFKEDYSTQPNLILYRNENSNGNNWLKVKLAGTEQNRDAIGARVEVIVEDHQLIRAVEGGSGYQSHSSIIQHFGLGQYARVDTVRVIWPGGMTQEYFDVQVNQTLEISEINTVTLNAPAVTALNSFDVYPNPSDGAVAFDFKLDDKATVSVYLLDNLGRRVSTLFEELQSSDHQTHYLQLHDKVPGKLAPGLYFLRTCIGNTEQISKLIIN